MKVIVTGSTGFVGKAVVDKLLQEDHSVIAAVRQMSTELPNTVEQVVIGDLAELPKADSLASGEMTGLSGQTVTDSSAVGRLSEALRGVDVVIHTAARVHVMNETEADPIDAFRKVNTEATLNLARQAAESGVKRFVFISTIKVNGESTSSKAPSPLAGQIRQERIWSAIAARKGGGHGCPPTEGQGEGGSNHLSHAQNVGGKPFDEEDMPKPQDPYAISKWEAEQGLIQIAEETGMEVVIIRPPLVYGPGVKGNFATMMKWLKRGIPLPLGAVNNQRSLLALENLVGFIQLCLTHPKAANETFLLADGEDVSTTELLKKLAKAMNKQPRLISIPVSWMTFAAKIIGKEAITERLFGSLQIDISKSRDLLGWKPLISMGQQLEKMAIEESNEKTV